MRMVMRVAMSMMKLQERGNYDSLGTGGSQGNENSDGSNCDDEGVDVDEAHGVGIDGGCHPA